MSALNLFNDQRRKLRRFAGIFLLLISRALYLTKNQALCILLFNYNVPTYIIMRVYQQILLLFAKTYCINNVFCFPPFFSCTFYLNLTMLSPQHGKKLWRKFIQNLYILLNFRLMTFLAVFDLFYLTSSLLLFSGEGDNNVFSSSQFQAMKRRG